MMIKIERILCPTDLSTESDEALQYAVALARIYEAQLLLLHCSEHVSLPEEQDEPKLESRVNSVFAESLVPHLGLTTIDDLNWRGLLRNNVQTPAEKRCIALRAPSLLGNRKYRRDEFGENAKKKFRRQIPHRRRITAICFMLLILALVE